MARISPIAALSTHPTARAPAAAAAVLALLLAGCGGGSEPQSSTPAARTAPAPPAGHDRPQQARPADVRVIRAWADTLRAGRTAAAARFFTVPSTVQNGTPPLRLGSRRAVRAFNEALPCGAKVVAAQRRSGFTIVTFTLTERPGPGSCGSGTGAQAATAFKLRGGRIAWWLRVPVPTEKPAPAAPKRSTSV